MSVVISVENVSKQYRLGKVGTGTITHDLNRWWHLFRGKEDPYLKVGETNDRTSKGSSEYVWALKDINFEIRGGDTVGIIGLNGAGKSTLLKILSRTTSPTTGLLKLKGRVASLLEVGTGFHPELSGRENVYLNGAILGMTRREITRKFDEIVEFSGVERYVDTPVKRYSSGMYVRLAFAVAAHLESEILIVDEVLAVGDAEFQKKCLGKMGEVSTREGRTVLFVSHNLHAIRNLCNNSILLEHGTITHFDNTQHVIQQYINKREKTSSAHYLNESSDKAIFLSSAYLMKDDGSKVDQFSADENINVILKIKKTTAIRGAYMHFFISNSEGLNVLETDTLEQLSNDIDTPATGIFDTVITIPRRILNAGKYLISLGISSNQAHKNQIESLDSFLSFEVFAETTQRDFRRKSITSYIPSWTTTRITN